MATVDTGQFPEKINEAHVQYLEEVIDEYVAMVEKGDYFIIPGTNRASASLHMARTVCRRAERRILTLKRDEPIRDILIQYINRLSDAIYSMARYLESDLKYVYFDKKTDI